MDAHRLTLNEFISVKRTFIIPVYQRNYDWKSANCEQLFNDIERIIEKSKPHFIGTFVSQNKTYGNNFTDVTIIDGQQRITSVILLAKALYDSKDTDDNLREDIDSTFIKHDKGDLKGKLKLRPSEYDNAAFDKLMKDKADQLTLKEKESAMYRNYCFFRERISDSTYDTKQIFNAMASLTVVSILLDEENPQEIFESLNSTGLDLTQADLIRNFLLMPLPYDVQKTLYDNYWYAIEKLLRPSNNVENFLVQYLITKRKSDSVTIGLNKKRLNNRNLYPIFKDYFHDNYKDDKATLNVEACLKDMFRYANFFHSLIFNDDTKFANLPALDKKFYELVYLLDANNAPIILMYLIDRYETKKDFNEATFIEFVDAMISLTFRAKVCRYAGIRAQFAGNVIARLDKESSLTAEAFWRAITFGKGRYAFPDNEEFMTALINNELYSPRKPEECKYMLYSLERAATPKANGIGLPPFDDATIEHILPQDIKNWKDYLEARNDLKAHEIWLNTLGNLTLLIQADNSKCSNATFDEKKKVYVQSNYPQARAIAEEYKADEWTSRQIQSRAKKLAMTALKVWKLPENLNLSSTNKGEIFYLNSDINAIKKIKPGVLYIDDKEIPMTNWYHLIHGIARYLYAYDSDSFRNAAKFEDIPADLFTTEPADCQLDENFYIKNVVSGVKTLRIAKVLAEQFDHFADTDFAEKIYFTLKK